MLNIAAGDMPDVEDEPIDEAEAVRDGNYTIFHADSAETFDFNILGVDVSLQQKPSAENLGHGAVVWEASAIFTKYMEVNFKKFSPEKLAGKTVFELGSGCGLGGLAFMMRGAAVVLSDLECVVETLTRANAAAIYARVAATSVTPLVRPSVVALDWTEEYICPPGGPEPPYDIVLLTDCVFSVELAPALVGKIKSLSGPRTEIYCCHEVRDEHTNTAFLSALRQICFIKRIPRTKLDPSFRNDMVELLSCKLLRHCKNTD